MAVLNPFRATNHKESPDKKPVEASTGLRSSPMLPEKETASALHGWLVSLLSWLYVRVFLGLRLIHANLVGLLIIGILLEK